MYDDFADGAAGEHDPKNGEDALEGVDDMYVRVDTPESSSKAANSHVSASKQSVVSSLKR